MRAANSGARSPNAKRGPEKPTPDRVSSKNIAAIIIAQRPHAAWAA
jgi:hypothetical protein